MNNCIIKVVDASRSRARFHECKNNSRFFCGKQTVNNSQFWVFEDSKNASFENEILKFKIVCNANPSLW